MKINSVCVLSHLYPVSSGDYKGVFVRDLAVSLANEGIETHVVTPMRPGAKRQEMVEGVRVHRFPYPGWQKGTQLGQYKGLPVLPLGSLIFIGILKAVLVAWTHNIDLFHAYWIVPGGFMARVAGWISRRPVVSTAAGSDLNIATSNPLVSGIARFTLGRLDAVISVSRRLKKKAAAFGVHEHRSVYIPGPVGIEMDSFSAPSCLKPRHSAVVRLLYLGNLAPPKRVDTLIGAAGHLADRGYDFRLVIAGEGPMKADLLTLADSAGVADRVVFKGRVAHDKVPLLMQSCHVFLHCSENEGLPVAIMEAMAAGLPVIAAGVGGIPELVEDGETGYLLSCEDSMGFAQKASVLIDDDRLRRRMGQKARDVVSAEYNKKTIIRKNLEVYHCVLGKGTA